jgi:Domain of unknown function (DUF4845)
MSQALPRTRLLGTRHSQSGLGFFGLVFVAVVVGGLGLITLKSFPIYSEYLKVQRIVKKVSDDSPKTAQELAAGFDRYAAIEDVSSVKGSDLILDTKSGKSVVSFSYSKKIPLLPPLSLVFDFEGGSR